MSKPPSSRPPDTGIPDSEVIATVLSSQARGDTNGAREAFRVLVERYQGRVFGLTLEIIRNQDDARDLTQDALVKAYLSLPDFKGESSFYSWLYRIAFNMALDLKRKITRRGGAPVEYTEGELHQSQQDQAVGAGRIDRPDEALLRKEQRAKIDSVMSQLSDEHRAIIMMREVDGLSYEEISDATGIPKGTVMSRLFYARKKLQEGLKEWAPAVVESDEGSLRKIRAK